MLSKLQKRYIIGIISYTVSIFIWRINESFGNVFRTNLILSITTDVKIPIENNEEKGFLSAKIITSEESKNIQKRNVLIIINHGFSDTIETYQYLYIPLALNGYTLLSYDSRGIGRSKSLGNRYEFEKRIQDFKDIVKWVQSEEELKQMSIYTIGFSIGAMVSLIGGFQNKSIKKLIAISSISSYKRSIKNMNPVVLLMYFLKKVPLFISDETGEKLSPAYTFFKSKQKYSNSDWHKLKERVMLIHSKNDKVTPFENFKENSNILNLKLSNKLIFKKGGHSMKKNEIEIVGSILYFLNKKIEEY
ncbi:MAG: alpha/beta fold hydrolase [Candidatus Lokiarchaeota archaeon]